MARNLITSGDSTARNVLGPWCDANGTVYAFIGSVGGANGWGLFRATDPVGGSWTNQLSGRPVGVSPSAIYGWQDGTVVHFIDMAAGQYHTYRTSDDGSNPDTWSIVDEDIGSGHVQDYPCGVPFVRSDGDVLFAYQGPQEKVHGTNFNRVCYARRESGSWTVDVIVRESGQQTNYTFSGAIGNPATDDYCVFFWEPTSGTNSARLIDSGNSLGTVYSSGTSVGSDIASLAYTNFGCQITRATGDPDYLAAPRHVNNGAMYVEVLRDAASPSKFQATVDATSPSGYGNTTTGRTGAVASGIHGYRAFYVQCGSNEQGLYGWWTADPSAGFTAYGSISSSPPKQDAGDIQDRISCNVLDRAGDEVLAFLYKEWDNSAGSVEWYYDEFPLNRLPEGTEAGDGWTAEVSTGGQQGSLVDGIEAGDTFAASRQTAGVFAEGLSGSDAILATLVTSAGVIDGAVAGETLAATIVTTQLVSEGLAAGDAFAASQVLAGDLSEGVQAGDTYTPSVALGGLLSEAMSAGDTQSATLATAAELTDAVVASDTILANEQSTVALSDGLIAGDTVDAVFEVAAFLADGLEAGDTVSSTLQAFGQVVEGVAVGETFTANEASTALLFDGIEAGDAGSSTLAALGLLADDLLSGETLLATLLTSASLSDAVEAGEAFIGSSLGIVSAAFPEGLSTGDALVAQVEFGGQLSEGSAVGEAVSVTGTLQASCFDAVITGETLSGALQTTAALADGTISSDEQATSRAISTFITEGFVAGDELDTVLEAIAHLGELVRSGEALSPTAAMGVYLSDTVLAGGSWRFPELQYRASRRLSLRGPSRRRRALTGTSQRRVPLTGTSRQRIHVGVPA